MYIYTRKKFKKQTKYLTNTMEEVKTNNEEIQIKYQKNN